MDKEKELAQLVERLKQAAGANLMSVVLYGSAASAEFQPRHSDLNVLCVLERLDAAELDRLNPLATWWAHRGHPAPLLFTLEELRRSADIFAIELLDIKANRRLLSGQDVFLDLDIPLDLHRHQVERELRTNLLRLREGYLVAQRTRSALLRTMTASVSTFVTLFRHALIALGEQPAETKRQIVAQLADLLGFDASGFNTVLDVREGRRRESDVDAAALFTSYLEALTRVTEEIDRRMEAGVR